MCPSCLRYSNLTPSRYEERSLGVFQEPEAEDVEEPHDFGKGAPHERVGRYLNWHVRRQLSVGMLDLQPAYKSLRPLIIDIWWLVWGVFFVAIIERGNLLDEEKKWFDLFRVLFELVSAFGGIGLSLGIPTVSHITDLFEHLTLIFNRKTIRSWERLSH